LPPVAVDATIADRHHHPSNRGDAMSTAIDRATFLRRSLQLDGIASAVCGVLLLAGARPLSDVIGLSAPGPARVVGTVAVAAVAAAVLGFTVLEVVGLRRLRAAAG
jgi:hypothetical protein